MNRYENKPKNNPKPRGIDAIYIRPAKALQGGHEVMDLVTGELIWVLKVDKCTMTRMVIARVEELVAQQGYRTLKFFNRKKE